MGSSESKMTGSAALKPEPAIKKTCVTHLTDPRSPSVGVARTPIQIAGPESKSAAEVKSECPPVLVDPRSPTVGITRTPVREVMRATVGSFARRLGMLFHSEAEGKAPNRPQKCLRDAVDEVLGGEELASTTPLLTPQLIKNFGSLVEHATLLATPVLPPLRSTGDTSPFVLLEEPQVEVEIETEEGITLDEAEEARETPVHKRLSMSLITCHEGAPSSQIYAEVHCEPNEETEPVKDAVDHSYACPVSVAPESELPVTTDVELSQVQESAAQPEEAQKISSSEESKGLNKESSLPPVLSEPPTLPSPKQPQVCTGIRCPTFDTKSPSQVEFKPQWLGKGFGATGLRARGVQRRSGKGGSSPLAVRVAVKNITNENKGQSGKLKQKDTEGRSPLQILKETNSPRDQRSQMRLKVSTQDKQRFGQTDRRVLVCLDKENR